MSQAPVKVIFIVGAGRSGTTLAAQLLGQVNGLFSAGELNYFWDAGYGRNQLCSCGVPLRGCEFWSPTAARVCQIKGLDTDEFGRLRTAVGRRAKIPRLRYRALRSRQFTRELQRYRKILGQFYTEIARQSGAEVIVDSSKDPAHGLVLAGAPGIDLRVLHLVRDACAVAHSHTRIKRKTSITHTAEFMPVRHPSETAVRWNTVNLLSWALFAGRDRYRLISYESLIADPKETIVRIARDLGDLADPVDHIRGHVAELSHSHTALGNPSKSGKGVFVIQPDDKWKNGLRRVHRYTVRALTLPVAALMRRTERIGNQ